MIHEEFMEAGVSPCLRMKDHLRKKKETWFSDVKKKVDIFQDKSLQN